MSLHVEFFNSISGAVSSKNCDFSVNSTVKYKDAHSFRCSTQRINLFYAIFQINIKICSKFTKNFNVKISPNNCPIAWLGLPIHKLIEHSMGKLHHAQTAHYYSLILIVFFNLTIAIVIKSN